ncbi:MAG: metabolite traffic protein EboE [Planctomycetes bacterium]|nr:metabolite traffic protein EboE [Planctomycetota bacterium]
MRWIGPRGPFDLTYCTNVHPGETLAEVEAYLAGPTTAVRRAVVGEGTMGLGLRLARPAVDELFFDPARRAAFARFLRDHHFEAWTVNGFPHGRFHSDRVKEEVFRPSWLDPERLLYTERLADVMIDLLPAARDFATISTLSGQFRPWGHGPEVLTKIAEILGLLVFRLAKRRRETGKRVMICLEAEPFSTLETVDEIEVFFSEYLSGLAARRLAVAAAISLDAARARVADHLGVCFDTCHHAVQFEDLTVSLRRLRKRGIPVGKVQLSSALAVERPGSRPEAVQAIEAFAEPRYLHQVVGRGPMGILRKPDLEVPADGRSGGWGSCDEWRCHFHVPVSLEAIGPLRTTRSDLEAALALVVEEGLSPHLEIETYTWDVLPEAARSGSGAEALVADITREFAWVAERLRAHGCSAAGSEPDRGSD